MANNYGVVSVGTATAPATFIISSAKLVTIQNNGSVPVDIGDDNAITYGNAGLRLYPQQSASFSAATWYGVAASGTASVYWQLNSGE